ncbi:MAG: 7-carboxy-7-deazaguanine synthase [Candidatus Marinimicrobia bacterium]|nr:7-carboxy-7-deazaguanine synthase [Candidatus Neomarinimicrobiota bacterium]|tara:strand:+ start:27190 stop:27831 length:642 start_codon:yes stop_codon:yes gene_type:complete
MKLMINEIYHSIQGESSYSGRPCIFIRLTYCNLRCSYCDSEHTFYEGEELTIEEILEKIKEYPCNLVEVTGGEPLFQKNCIILLQKLVENKYEVLLETSGSLSIESVPKQVINIIDFKCPSSKMVKKNLWENINYLKKDDEIKFVIADKEDYVWAKNKISEYELTKKSNILMSPAYNEIESKKIVDWILRDNLNVRFQIQLHKEIWDPDKKGV